MAALSEKIQNALDEGRILILGAQILLGIEYRSFFEPSFPSLPPWARTTKLLALCVMLVAFALLALPSSYRARPTRRCRSRPPGCARGAVRAMSFPQ